MKRLGDELQKARFMRSVAENEAFVAKRDAEDWELKKKWLPRLVTLCLFLTIIGYFQGTSSGFSICGFLGLFVFGIPWILMLWGDFEQRQ